MLESKDMTIQAFKHIAHTKHPAPIPPEISSESCNNKNPSEIQIINNRNLLDFYERRFWRTLRVISEPPLYGADMSGSLFGNDNACSWNLNKLDTMLQLIENTLPGITKSMLYVGMWKAMFAFHKEDMDLYSINYLHKGAPKLWYAIPVRKIYTKL